MKRGDIVIVRQPRTPASKARPCVVVQRDGATAVPWKATVCPLTSQLRGAMGQRPTVAATPATGLTEPSEVQIDWIFTHPVEHIGAIIGSVDAVTMERIDAALRLWLGL